MFFDAHADQISADLSYDICIVGAGAAGNALAQEFASKRGRRICLLEGGGLEYEDVSPALYSGEIDRRDFAELDSCRLHYFGGSTNHWGGYFLPLSNNSFEQRPCHQRRAKELSTAIAAFTT